MSERCKDLNELLPEMKKATEYLIEACNYAELPILVTETFRTPNRQRYLWDQGRSRPGIIVTNMDGVNELSVHQKRKAVDVCYNRPGDAYNVKKLALVGKLGQMIGLEWGGSWPTFIDMPHFELSNKKIRRLTEAEVLSVINRFLVTKIKIVLNGVSKDVSTISIHGHNHVKLRDLMDSSISIKWENGKIFINGYHFKGDTITQDSINYIKLRTLPTELFEVGFSDGLASVKLK